MSRSLSRRHFLLGTTALATLALARPVAGQEETPPNVVATFPLDRAAEAMALVESGHSAGKVVIVP